MLARVAAPRAPWLAGFVVAGVLHGLVLVALLGRLHERTRPPDAVPVFDVALASVAAAETPIASMPPAAEPPPAAPSWQKPQAAPVERMPPPAKTPSPDPLPRADGAVDAAPLPPTAPVADASAAEPNDAAMEDSPGAGDVVVDSRPTEPAPRGALTRQERNYFAVISAHLNRRKTYPAEAKQARQQGVVVVRFRIDRDGHVLSADIRRGSGHALLDDATVELLRRVSPLPRIPRSIDRDELTLSLPIDYALTTD
ncbi:hypothetical protein GCM10028794_23290 [Silanimonas algicola]